MKQKKILLHILSELAQYPKWFYTSVFLSLIISGVSIARPLLIHDQLNHISQTTIQQLILFGTGLILLMIIESILQYAHSIISVTLGQTFVLKTRQKLYQHILNLPVSYFDNTPVGTLVTRVVSDMESMNEIFAEGFTTIFGSIITILTFITIMFYVNIYLSFAILIVLPVLLLLIYWFKNSVQKSFTDVRNAIAQLNRFVQERLQGMSIVQQFNAEEIEFEKFKRINEQHKKAHIRSVGYYSIFFPLLELLTTIAISLIIYFSSLLPNIALGDITFFVMMTQMLFRPLRLLADQLNIIQMGLVAAERVYAVMKHTIPQTNEGTVIFQQLKKGIELKNVTFYYSDKQTPVLSNINVFIPARKITAIVGHTGSGKTTLIHLITRLYDIQQGEIWFDDTPVQNFTLHSLRNKIAVVLQDPHLFKDTILNNVRMFNPAITQDQVEKAAQEIGIHEFILQLENQYNHIIQERGANLSSGQKQLIAFLRAYLHKPELFILDEATSMIDSQMEQLIQQALKKILQNRTAIIIAHRLSTIQMAHQIIVLHQGKIVETGTHAELLQQHGLYKTLYQAQMDVIEI